MKHGAFPWADGVLLHVFKLEDAAGSSTHGQRLHHGDARLEGKLKPGDADSPGVRLLDGQTLCLHLPGGSLLAGIAL